MDSNMTYEVIGENDYEVYDARINKREIPHLLRLAPKGHYASKQKIINDLLKYNNNLIINYNFVDYTIIASDKNSWIKYCFKDKKVYRIEIYINDGTIRNYIVDEETKIGIDMLIENLDIIERCKSYNDDKISELKKVNTLNRMLKHIMILEYIKCKNSRETLYCEIKADATIMSKFIHRFRNSFYDAIRYYMPEEPKKYKNKGRYIRLDVRSIIGYDAYIDELINEVD